MYNHDVHEDLEIHRVAEVIDDGQRQLRIRILIVVHLFVGTVLALATAFLPMRRWPFIVELGYAGFLASEILLLGMWAGLQRGRQWIRLWGLFFGIAWLSIVLIAGTGFQNVEQALPAMVLVLLVINFAVSGSLILFRWLFLAGIEYRDEWPPTSHSEEFQFSLKSLLWLTALIGTLLAAGGTVRGWGGGSLGIFAIAIVFALGAMLITWLVAWAGLGGNNWVRFPFALTGIALVGFLPPYYLRTGTPTWEWLTWPAVSVSTGVFTLASLYVVRICGYRLVRFREPVKS